jgi:hypothetical protein
MNEVRRIVGVIDELPAGRKDVAFPAVRAWIHGLNDYETRGLRQYFLDRGTVFLHVSACEGQQPQRLQVGLFVCVPSPGEKAEWKVNTTSKHLVNVVHCPPWDRDPRPLTFWQWLSVYKNGGGCKILLGDSNVFVRRGPRQLIGPFSTSPEGKLVCRDQISVFEDVQPITIDVAGRTYELIDTELLQKGRPIVVDPQDAIRRRLKLASRQTNMDWLSRARIQELSAALAGLNSADGSEWVTDILKPALEAIGAGVKVDPALAETILQVPVLAQAVEKAWKTKHAEAIRAEEQQLKNLKTGAANIAQKVEESNKELIRRTDDQKKAEQALAQIQQGISEATRKAQQAFDDELKRLAKSPASLAVLAAWGTGARINDRTQLPVTIQKCPASRESAPNLQSALFNNLRAAGLSPISAKEVSVTCCAAIYAGQPISFRSLYGDLLAQAVTNAIAPSATVCAEVPAGLLDPVAWEDITPAEHMTAPMILHGANRSDINIVLGSLRPLVLRQAIGSQKPSHILVMTMESQPDLRVQSEFPLGPTFDDKTLKFNSGKPDSPLHAFLQYAIELVEIEPAAAEDFGQEIQRLPLLATSAEQIAHRRAYAALQKHAQNEALRLFFKYWCLARITAEASREIIESHKQDWQQDQTLVDLLQTFEDGH